MKVKIISQFIVLAFFVFAPILSFSNYSISPGDNSEIQVDTVSSLSTSNILLEQDEDHSFNVMTWFRGLLGMLVLVGIGFLFSRDRRNIPWKTVIVGLAFQITLAVGVLYVPFMRLFFEINL